MAKTINIATKQSGDTLTSDELNTIVDTTNAAITEQNETKAAHAQAISGLNETISTEVQERTNLGERVSVLEESTGIILTDIENILASI